MPINGETEIQLRLSGGTANTNASASLGGAMSTDAGGVISDNVLNNIFDNVSGPESSAGRVEFRCIYVYNANATLELTNAKVWRQQDTNSNDDFVQVGLGVAAIGADEVAVLGAETDVPAGVTFADHSTAGTALTLGNIPALSKKSIWIKRQVNAGAGAFDNNTFALQVDGESL